MKLQDKITKIRSSLKTPIIGIIGATSPNKEYSSSEGIEAGRLIRQYLDSNEGTAFTGGVDGVGADAYTGILKYCIQKAIRTGSMPATNAFVLIPHFAYISAPTTGFILTTKNEKITIRYNPPAVYDSLGSLTAEGKLQVVRAGEDMRDRREFVGNIADALVMINGGKGTLEEAIFALSNQKPVIVLSNSGGAANYLDAWKNGDEEVLETCADEMFQIPRIIKKPLIHPISSVDELESTLKNVLNNTK